jgi:hypothetical protein
MLNVPKLRGPSSGIISLPIHFNFCSRYGHLDDEACGSTPSAHLKTPFEFSERHQTPVSAGSSLAGRGGALLAADQATVSPFGAARGGPEYALTAAPRRPGCFRPHPGHGGPVRRQQLLIAQEGGRFSI